MVALSATLLSAPIIDMVGCSLHRLQQTKSRRSRLTTSTNTLGVVRLAKKARVVYSYTVCARARMGLLEELYG